MSARRLPPFFFVGHDLKLPIMVAFTTSWLASLKQPCSLWIRRVKTMFLTSEMLPLSLRQLPWKCVPESTRRSLGPGLGRNKIPSSKAFGERAPGKRSPSSRGSSRAAHRVWYVLSISSVDVKVANTSAVEALPFLQTWDRTPSTGMTSARKWTNLTTSARRRSSSSPSASWRPGSLLPPPVCNAGWE